MTVIYCKNRKRHLEIRIKNHTILTYVDTALSETPFTVEITEAYRKHTGKGSEIISQYDKCYYCHKKRDPMCPHTAYISERVEKEIFRGKWDSEYIFDILAWKTGKISHAKSDEDDRIFYHAGWNKDALTIKLPYQKHTEKERFERFAEEVLTLHKEYTTGTPASTIWIKLLGYANDAQNEINGLGTTYLLTILSFITDGACPIYDRFAMASLMVMAIEEAHGIDISHGCYIHGLTLPDHKSKAAQALLLEGSHTIYRTYILLLDHFFGDQWKNDKDRNIDKALWVYGHYFKP